MNPHHLRPFWLFLLVSGDVVHIIDRHSTIIMSFIQSVLCTAFGTDLIGWVSYHHSGKHGLTTAG
jgi:hypothetical protein